MTGVLLGVGIWVVAVIATVAFVVWVQKTGR